MNGSECLNSSKLSREPSVGASSSDINRCTFTIYHQNVCGISTKKEELDMYLNNMDASKPKYVCITEHFLNPKNVALLNLTNYKLVAYNVRSNMIRGGSLILGLNNCNYEEVSICTVLYKQEYFEICGIKDKDTNLNICCLYYNGKILYFNDFMTQLEKLLTYFFNKKCIIGGDFNVDLLKDDKNKVQFLSLLKCYNFRALIDSGTYICGDARSCLDNFLTNILPESLDTITVDHNGLSDGHAGLFSTLSLPCKVRVNYKERYIKVMHRIFSTKNNDRFRENILKREWNNFGISSFLKNFNECFTMSFKKIYRKYKVNSDNIIKWVTMGIRTSSKMKRFLMTVNKLTHDISLVEYRNNYIRVFRKVIRNAKRLAVQSELRKSKNRTKSIWRIVNKHRNKVATQNRQKIVLQVGDNTVVNEQEIVEIFSDQFNFESTSGSSVVGRVNSLRTSNIEVINKDMSWTPITPFEIQKILRTMERKKSSGYDEMPITVIQDNVDILAESLSKFYNECYNQGVFPEQLKIAKIIPIYKKGKRTDPMNYRPISLLPVLAKIFEKLIKVRLLNHLERYNILNVRQFGYQRNRGAKDAVHTLIDDIVVSLNEKKKVSGLFLDLSSAFDTIDHVALAKKLELYGVRGKTLQLFQSYLNNRYQFVEVISAESEELVQCKSRAIKIKRGVPQGSILGPILFIIFTNDLIKFIEDKFTNVKLVVFADDTNAVISAENLESLELKTNEVLSAFDFWFKNNNLVINTSKTNVLLFRTTARNHEHMDIMMTNKIIPLVESVKFLGIYIDSFLNWQPELSKLENKISSSCYALRSLRDEASVADLKMVYHAIVESHLRYSIRFWGNSYDYNVKKAFILQKRAIRTIARIPLWESCRPYFRQLSILTVPCLYILELLTGVTECSSDFSKDIESDRLVTRRKDRRGVIAPKFNIIKHSPRYQTTKIYNSLPRELKMVQDHISFKKRLKRFLLEKSFYCIDELVETFN